MANFSLTEKSRIRSVLNFDFCSQNVGLFFNFYYRLTRSFMPVVWFTESEARNTNLTATKAALKGAAEHR